MKRIGTVSVFSRMEVLVYQGLVALIAVLFLIAVVIVVL